MGSGNKTYRAGSSRKRWVVRILVTFLALAIVGFGGFALDSANLSRSREDLQQATYISVLAILQNRSLSVEEMDNLANEVTGVFADIYPSNTIVSSDGKRLFVDAKLRVQTLFIQFFGISSLDIEIRSQGKISLTNRFVADELKAAVAKLKDTIYYSDMVGLLDKYKSRNIAALNSQINPPIDGKIDPDTSLGPGNNADLEDTGQSPALMAMIKNSPATPALPMPVLRGTGAGQAGKQTGYATTQKPQAALPPARQPEPRGGIATDNGRIIFDSTGTYNLSKFLKKYDRNKRQRKNSGKVILQALLRDGNTNTTVNYGSGVNVFKMLRQPKPFERSQEGNSFLWSDLWRYFKVTYKASQERASQLRANAANEDKKPKSVSQLEVMVKFIIEISFYLIIAANFVLWAIIAGYFLRRRRRSQDVKKVARTSRLDRVIS